jgi:hypothetical protein
MRILDEYDLGGQHYGLVELDNGSKVEIQDKDPLARATTMTAAGIFSVSMPAVESNGKTIVDFSDAEITMEVSRRKLIIKGTMI